MKHQNKRAGYFIGVTCPGCGGDLELQSDFCMIECEHCCSVLRISTPTDQPLAYYIKPTKDKRAIRFQVDRYLKKHNRSLTGSGYKLQRLYYPYWKMDGISLKVRTEAGKEHRAADNNILTAQIDYAGVFQYGRALGKILTSPIGPTEAKTQVKLSPHSSTIMAGSSLLGMPPSLGMRAEYIKLYPLATEEIDTRFTYASVVSDWDDVKSDLHRSAGTKSALFNSGGQAGRDRLFGLKGSLLYFPYFVLQMAQRDEQSRFLLDGVSGRVVHVGPPIEADDVGQSHNQSQSKTSELGGYGQLDISLHRCSNCGDDLHSYSSFIHICKDCQRVNLIGESALFSGEISIASSGDQSDRMFPFWVMADQSTNNEIVVPAFKISNFEVTRRLSQKVSVAVPEIPRVKLTDDDERLQPVAIGPDEAVQMAEVLQYCQQALSGQSAPATSTNASPGMMSLIYMPFHLRNYFYVDSILNTITFEKSAVR